MGEDWRSWKGSCRPPRPGYSSVPSWEKKFCSYVCSIPWGKIVEAQASLSGHKTIVEWDDSGAYEAFNNAKARYFADISDLHCAIPLPDPDMYIDEVDDNAFVDPELVADLYRRPPTPPPSSNEYEDLSYQSFLNRTLPVRATGWDEPEEQIHPLYNALMKNKFPAAALQNKWDEAEVQQATNRNSGSSRTGNRNIPVEVTGWNGGEEEAQPKSPAFTRNQLPADGLQNGGCIDGVVGDGSWRSNGHDNSWGNQNKHVSRNQHFDNGYYERGRRNGRGRNGHNSRFSKGRFPANNHQPSPCMAANTFKKTMHAGKPVATAQQWMPKHAPPPVPISG